MAITDGEVLKAVAEVILADGTITQMVFHFLTSFIADQTNSAVVAAIVGYVEDIMDAVNAYTASTADFNPMEVNVVEWDGTEAEWLTTRYVGQDTPTWTGAAGGDILPNQVAPVLMATTLRPKTRGRKFLPAFAETASQGSTIITAVMTTLATALAHYIADESISANNDLIVGVPSGVTGTFKEFSVGDVSDVIGSQRRRKPGVGA